MRHTTEAIGSVRQSAEDPRIIEGTVIPYGVVSADTELMAGSGVIVREAFMPGAFRDDVARWTSRQDGGRMAYRPAHREKPVGTVLHLEDTPTGVAFRASIFETPAGDEYLSQVRAGLNGVSAELSLPSGTRKTKDGVLVHRSGKLVAIAGSVNPAYDGARIALRDMEETVSDEKVTEPAVNELDAKVTEPATVAERAAAERSDVASTLSQVVITRPEAVYHRDGENTYMQDTWLAQRGGDATAHERLIRHQAHLKDIAIQMERDAYSRIFDPGHAERAGDVLSSEIPGAYPNEYLPGLLTPRILKGRPMGGFYQRIPIADARPRVFPKVTTSSTVAVQSSEGAALSATDIATTAVTATPLMYGAYTDVSRQALDGGDPSVLAIIYQDLLESYAQVSEAAIKTAVEAGSTASGTAITAVTPYAGVLGNVITYYGTRFKPAEGAFIPSALYSVLLAQGDTTGRPFLPMIGATNSDGSVSAGGLEANVLNARTKLSYASTVNVCVFGVPSDFVIFESSIAQFQYDQIANAPANIRVGLWAYLVVGTRLGALKVPAA
jgi:phage head maturation protease